MANAMANGMLIHVRANPLVGTGRLLRSLTLARQWILEGGNVVFVAGPLPAILLRQIAISGCDIERLKGPVSDPDFCKQLCEMAKRHHCEWIVTDDSNTELIRNLGERQGQGPRLLVLGSVDQAGFRGVDFVTGDEPAYALIRNNLGKYPPPRLGKQRPKRCLIELSRLDGAASAQIIKQVCRDFCESDVIFEFVTPFAVSAADQLYQQQAEVRKQLFWHRNSDRVFASLYSFDLAVTTDAANFFETAYCGLASCFLSPFGSGDGELLADITTRSWMLDCRTSDWPQRAVAAIGELLNRPAALTRHASEMCRLADDQGAVRLCKALQPGGQQHAGHVRSA